MQIKGELQDERDERFHTDSLQTRANAMNDGSNHDYDKDRFSGRHEVKQDGQPREDMREIIRRAQEHKRTKNHDKEDDRDKEHDDNRRRNEKRK
jgi:hypothetical protein